MKTIWMMGGLLSTVCAVNAAELPPPLDRLSLSASASVEVTRDVLGVTLSTTKEGSDAAGVQVALKQALDAALSEARKVAKPGQIEVQTGNFSLYPRYAPKGSGITGWQGSAELLIEGKDTAAIAQLVGRISSLTIARVGYSLSKEQREKVEGEVSAQAIARYKARAADYARQFGYGGYRIAEVNVNTAEATPMMAQAAPMRMKTMAMAADEALPVEAGKANVSVTVNGVVLLTK